MEVLLVLILVLAPVDGAELEHLVAAADAGRAALGRRSGSSVGVGNGLNGLGARVGRRGGRSQGEEVGERSSVGQRHFGVCVKKSWL